jgi:hypothetical protein
LGPLFSSTLKSINWNAVFFGSAIITAINLILIFLIKENKIANNKITFTHILKESINILKNTFTNIVKAKVIIFLILMIAFTINHMQFYETLPNFMSD